jgi:hypothetical protein
MTNLLLAKKFFTEVFGAICFYNDTQDGYVELNDGRKLETLAIYFPNKVDLYDEETKSRLTKEAGEEFYKRYCGADGKMICGIFGNRLLVAYHLNGEVIGIREYVLGGLKGGCNLMVDYFCGIDLKGAPFGVRCFTETVQTNNNLKIIKGEDIEETIERFLFTDNFSPCQKSQLFHLPKTKKYYFQDEYEMREKISNAFPNEWKVFSKIGRSRNQLSQQQFLKLTKEEYNAFLEDMGITLEDLRGDKYCD